MLNFSVHNSMIQKDFVLIMIMFAFFFMVFRGNFCGCWKTVDLQTIHFSFTVIIYSQTLIISTPLGSKNLVLTKQGTSCPCWQWILLLITIFKSNLKIVLTKPGTYYQSSTVNYISLCMLLCNARMPPTIICYTMLCKSVCL